MARPTKFNQEHADSICEHIAAGKSLVSWCNEEGRPHYVTVMRWVKDDEEFRNRYACAREAQADFLADDIIAISDEECTMVRAEKHGSKDEDGSGQVEVVFDATAVARNRLRVDARKWYASKLAPKKYGDKVEQVHSGEIDHGITLIERRVIDPGH